jgi:tetratricopeptide (TPR) repeat protein
VARGTQHRKRRPRTDVAVAAQPAARSKRPKRPAYEEQLFFGRLRKHGKIFFLFMVVVFVVSFVFLGVGSGSTGISSVLENFFTGSSSSGKSLSSLQKATVDHPKDAAAWLAYANKLQADKKTDEAAQALTTYTTLKPNDVNELRSLAALYYQRATDWYTVYQEQQSYTQTLSPSPLLSLASTSKLQTALSTVTNPLSTAISSDTSTNVSTAYEQFASELSSWENTYKKIGKLQPNDASTQLSLAEAAQQAADTKTEIAAYKRFLKLAPNDSEAPAARKALKAAEKQQASASASASTSTTTKSKSKPKAKSSGTATSATTTSATTTTSG